MFLEETEKNQSFLFSTSQSFFVSASVKVARNNKNIKYRKFLKVSHLQFWDFDNWETTGNNMLPFLLPFFFFVFFFYSSRTESVYYTSSLWRHITRDCSTSGQVMDSHNSHLFSFFFLFATFQKLSSNLLYIVGSNTFRFCLEEHLVFFLNIKADWMEPGVDSWTDTTWWMLYSLTRLVIDANSKSPFGTEQEKNAQVFSASLQHLQLAQQKSLNPITLKTKVIP